MNSFYRRLSYLLVLVFMLPSGAVAYDAPFRLGVQNELLNSFEVVPPLPEVPKPPIKEGFAKVWQNMQKLWTKQEFSEPYNSKRDRIQQAFTLFPATFAMPSSPVVDLELLNKLEILHGGADGSASLVHKLTNDGQFIYTGAGLKSFAELLSMPTINTQEIKKRQTIIKELFNNSPLRTNLVELYKKMGVAEPYLYDIYRKDGLSAEDQTVYPRKVMQMLGLSEIPTAIDIVNTLYAAYPLFVYVSMTATMYGYGKGLGWLAKDVPPYNLFPAEKVKKTVAYTTAGIYATLQAPITISQFGEIKAQLELIAHLQLKMINVAAYVRCALDIVKQCAYDKTIAAAMPELNRELMAYATNNAGSKRFQKLIELLRAATFDGPLPSLLSSPGKILIAYKLMSEKETCADFALLFDKVAQLEAYLAMAQKMKAHEKADAGFCFVEFDTKSATPYIDGNNIWNPFIPADKAIGNDFMLNRGNERDILLTGPNTSGKSTFIKSVMMSLVMAQSFGVAPATSLHMTPFAKLLSYMSITDNVAAGISQFKAETIRAAELKRVVLGLRPHEFAFFILDEIFTGTAPEQAEKLSYQFISNLAKVAHVLFINATHFKKLATLEQETDGVIKNYHLGAVVDAHGNVTSYTRKLVPGVAQYSSAEQVAKEAGVTPVWQEPTGW